MVAQNLNYNKMIYFIQTKDTDKIPESAEYKSYKCGCGESESYVDNDITIVVCDGCYDSASNVEKFI